MAGICKILSKQGISHQGYWDCPLEVEQVGAAANTVTSQKEVKWKGEDLGASFYLFFPTAL